MSRALGFAITLAWAAPALADAAYFAAIEDLPLPPGFVELDTGWSIEVDEGRLTEVRAQGSGDVQSARRFYVQTMPQLGWSQSPQLDDTLAYVRGRQRLMFSFSAPSDGRVELRARLLENTPPLQAD
jgi:hypothetical protein